MLLYMEGCSGKFNVPNKIVEIDGGMFGRRKYHRIHPVNRQWMFDGVEREFGKTFHVLVPDRTAESLKAVLDAWIEPCTTVISECWGAYRDLDAEGYTHRHVNYNIAFVDQGIGDNTNTIDCTHRHVKVFLSPYNRMEIIYVT
jgi:hypothetical protein